ncbi:MAG TPA: hypothetical protein PK054_00810 [Anaerohalosphaeraceae bacterium]|nr:hypothetical protein [Anaerohalosphaeraceae bacterium]HOL87751.1 hypothetical protein [Anaerohalosphaeraceae bacterium]HPP55103.1 hypothetical protein [Anaerohalosphaeraceae bacterium]
MNSAENIEQQIKKHKPNAELSPTMDRRILTDSIAAMQSARLPSEEKHPHSIRKTLMYSRIGKFAAAAVVPVAIGLFFVFFNKTIQPVNAAELLGQAIQTVTDIRSIHIQARMRTYPHDNFSQVDLKTDFVPIEMWARFENNNFLQMRIDKPQRVLSVDNGKATMIIQNEFVSQGNCASYACYDSEWLSRLMAVNRLLENELLAAIQNKEDSISVYHREIEGEKHLILERFSPAHVHREDYLHNKFIQDSDRTLIYRFEPQTKRLEEFQIFVHTDNEDILVFETTDIQYNPFLQEDLFSLKLPQQPVEFLTPQVLPDNESYENMTPEQAAEGFFTACARENWEEVLRYLPMTTLPQNIKDYLGGLEILSLGKSFLSEGSSARFVPYEIRLKNGTIKKHNLALKRIPPANRWIVDGGI